MRLLILLLSLCQSILVFASAGEDAAISMFQQLELASRVGETNAEEKAKNYFATLDRQTQPRAWLYFQTLIQTQGADSEALSFDAWLDESRKLKDQQLMIYVLMARLNSDVARGLDRLTIMDHLKEGIAVCRAWDDAFWCGRFYAELSNYLFNINDQALGLDYAKRATALLDKIEGFQRYYLYDAQAILANLLDRSGQSKQALNLMESNFAWFSEQGYLGDAAVMANNIALKLMRENDEDKGKIRTYVERARELVAQFPNEELISHVNYTQGIFFQQMGEHEQARRLLSQSYKDYVKFGMKNLAYDALISLAKAEFELGRLDELNQSLKLAEPMLQGSYSRESLLLLELKYLVAKKNRDFPKALSLHEELLALWKKIRKDEDLKQKNRLSVELGLQVEEQRNELLQKENELSALQLKSAERIKYFALLITVFFAVTVILLSLTFKQKERIHASKRKLKRILDSIDQGLFTIDERLRIGADYSQKTLTILDARDDISGQTFEDVTLARSSLSPESKSMLCEILRNTLGEDVLAWELNAPNLASELQIQRSDRLVNIRWIPILDSRNCVSSILVALTDVSDQRKLTQALQEKNRQLQGLPDKLREILEAPHPLLADFFTRTQDCLRQVAIDRNIEHVRQIHTQKGIARTYGLRSISSALHDLESSLQGESIQNALANCQRELAESEAFLTIVGQYLAPERSAGLPWLPTILSPHLKTWMQYAQDNGLAFHALTIKDEILHWSKSDLDFIEEICVHAMNNSLDHGFCLPKRSGTSVNNPDITIRAYRRNARLALEITDNGVGLDLQKLRLIAEQRGIAVLNDEALTDLVFMDEVSTAQDVSHCSGRGMGLAAVKSRVEGRLGSIHIRNRSDSQGAVLAAEWTASCA